MVSTTYKPGTRGCSEGFSPPIATALDTLPGAYKSRMINIRAAPAFPWQSAYGCKSNRYFPLSRTNGVFEHDVEMGSA